jgi:EmrB/QacA subfamily drug resistance transporter
VTARSTIEPTEVGPTPPPEVESVPQGSTATLLVLLSATFMTILDSFIVNVAIPSIEVELEPSQSQIQLVVASYTLTYAAGLMASGRLGDRFGHRTVFTVGMALFVMASLGCGIAPTIDALLVARAAQGVAAALMVPQVLTLLGTLFGGSGRARAFRWFGITLGLASGTGQIIGGALIDLNALGLGWRSCFLINIPIGLAALAASRRTLPASAENGDRHLDLVGAVVITSAMAALVLPLIEGRQQGWPLWTFVSFGAAAVLFVLFGANARRLTRLGGAPLIDVQVLTNVPLMTGMATVMVFYSAVASFSLVLSIYLQQGRGLGPFASGAVFSITVVGFLVTTFAGRRVTTALGRHSLTVGAAVIAFGHLGMGSAVVAIGTDGALPWLFAPMLVTGAGTGLVMVPLVSTMLARVDPTLAGTASGLYSSGQQLGNTIGVALIGIVYFGTTGPNPTSASIVDGLAVSHLYLSATAAVVAGLLRRLNRYG